MLDEDEGECKHYQVGYSAALLDAFDPVDGWFWRDSVETIRHIPPELQQGVRVFINDMFQQVQAGFAQAEAERNTSKTH